jgi:hypothetical protein
MEAYDTQGVQYLPACNPIDRIEGIGTICIKDTCLDIPLAASQGLQSRCLESSSVAGSLINDRYAKNKQHNKHK